MKPFDEMTDDEFTALVQSAASLPDVPSGLRQAALDLWPNIGPSRLATLMKQARETIQAALTFDSWADSALVLGVRSAGSDSRQLLYRAGELDIDLRISRHADTFGINGQVLGPDAEGTLYLEEEFDGPDHASIRERRVPAASARDTLLDELGEFAFDDVRAGKYRLTLNLGGDAIVLVPLEVGEQME